ncbi:MAG: adenylate/guanylate cyclase domain-containing protein [Verrucomicrobiota bacterium]|nr:adenylate/guanylate cyclase domain-containing protein [Verrucomicrobiota bacterium]
MKSKIKSYQLYQLICFLILFLLFFTGILKNLFQSMELRLFDLKSHALYRIEQIIHPSSPPPITFVAIDQYSVDPSQNPDTDRWNAGGWLTRRYYGEALKQFALAWHPKVIGYDIIFQNYRSSDESKLLGQYFEKTYSPPANKPESFAALLATPGFPIDPLIRTVEVEGLNKFANLLWDVTDSSPGMKIIWAFNFDYKKFSGGKNLRLDDHKEPAKNSISSHLNLLNEHSLKAPPGFKLPARALIPDGVNLPPSSLSTAPVHLAPINVFPDVDGVIRRVPLFIPYEDNGNIRYCPSLSMQLLLDFLGGAEKIERMDIDWNHQILIHVKDGRRYQIPIDEKGCLQLNPTRKLRDFNIVSYFDTIRFGPVETSGSAPAGLSPRAWETQKQIAAGLKSRLQDKALIIGTSFTGAGDVVSTSLDKNTPGAYIHMLAFANILDKECLPPPMTPGQTAILLAIITVLFCTMTFFLRQTVWLAGSVVVFFGYVFLSFLAQLTQSAILPIFIPCLMMGVQIASAAAINYFTESRERRRVRSLFSTMVSPSLLEYLEEHHAEALAGKQCEVTVMFSDVAGFTTISEKLNVDQLRGLFLDYLSPMTGTILASGGMVDKYIGDAIMAVWGVPLHLDNHAVAACRGALAQQKQIAALREQIARDYGVEIEVRMGINSGTVSAGNMGSHQRQQYTVMGDCVNQAARLEPINKDYGTWIVIGENTYNLVKDHFFTRCLDKIVVKGKTTAVTIHELVAENTTGSAPEWLGVYESAMQAFWRRDWDQAITLWADVSKCRRNEDEASIYLTRRALLYQETPPPENWQGEFWKKSKE